MDHSEQARLAAESPTGCPPVELIDRTSWETLQRLAQAGIVQLASAPTRLLHRADGDGALPAAEPSARAA